MNTSVSECLEVLFPISFVFVFVFTAVDVVLLLARRGGDNSKEFD